MGRTKNRHVVGRENVATITNRMFGLHPRRAFGMGAIGAVCLLLIAPSSAFELVHTRTYDDKNPIVSISVTSFNRRAQLEISLTQILKLTYHPFVLFVMDDGSEDGAVEAAVKLLDDYPDWPMCTQTIQNVRWPDGVAMPEYKSIGTKCKHWHSIVAAYVYKTMNEFESAANNFAMRHTQAYYYVWAQDDNFMTQIAWDFYLIRPLAKFPDAFSASMRCAHGWNPVSDLVGAKCSDQNANETLPYAYYVRDTGNRGPIAFHGQKMREIGFVDLTYAGISPEDIGDHEINTRAWLERRWVSGFVPVAFTAFSSVPGLGRGGQSDAVRNDYATKRARYKLKSRRFVPNTHNEIREL